MLRCCGRILSSVLFRPAGQRGGRFGKVDLFAADPVLKLLSRLTYPAVFLLLSLVLYGGTLLLSWLNGDLLRPRVFCEVASIEPGVLQKLPKLTLLAFGDLSGFVATHIDILLEERIIRPGRIEYGLLQDIPNLLILPLLVPLCGVAMIHYLRVVPRTLERLLGEKVLLCEREWLEEEFQRSPGARFIRGWSYTVILAVALLAGLVLAQLSLRTKMLELGINDWMFSDGFTPAYYYLYTLLTILALSLLRSVVKSFAVTAFMFHLFRPHELSDGVAARDEGWPLQVQIRALHFDRAGGLRSLGGLCMSLHVLLFLVGAALACLYLKTTMLWGQTIPPVSAMSAMGAYVAFAPLLFFLPAWSAHTRMRRARSDALGTLVARFDTLYRQLIEKVKIDAPVPEEHTDELARLRKLYDIASAMPVWPFDARSLSVFFASVVLPMLGSITLNLLGSVF